MELPRAVQKKKKIFLMKKSLFLKKKNFFSQKKEFLKERKASSLGIMSKNKLSLLYPK